jgi:hypothetical protein
MSHCVLAVKELYGDQCLAGSALQAALGHMTSPDPVRKLTIKGNVLGKNMQAKYERMGEHALGEIWQENNG